MPSFSTAPKRPALLAKAPLLAKALGLALIPRAEPGPKDRMRSDKTGSPEGSKGQLLSFVGGGGKTSAMYRLAGELALAGCRVLVTTTTRIRQPQPPWVAESLCYQEGRDWQPVLAACGQSLARRSPVALTSPAENGKAGPLPAPLLAELPGLANYVLVEADGSRGLPLKAPAAHEPSIPPQSDLVIAVTGLSGLGKPLTEVCHRPQRAAALLGCRPDAPADLSMLCRLLLHREGLAKGLPPGARFALLFNQADVLPKGAAGFHEIAAEVQKTADLPSMVRPDCLLLCALQTAVPLWQALGF